MARQAHHRIGIDPNAASARLLLQADRARRRLWPGLVDPPRRWCARWALDTLLKSNALAQPPPGRAVSERGPCPVCAGTGLATWPRAVRYLNDELAASP